MAHATAHTEGQQQTAHVEGQQHPIKLYLVVWDGCSS
jgi:cytochrome c oxidase subunit IV